ncbi:MAG: DUF21 domain-containing protein [Planctomycetaceae bacterium]|nr:DUF21 domain-containing protein [Planctomycetaceae bacterium]
MNGLATMTALALCLFLSAVFSGSETGFYSLSRARLEADAQRGRRSARYIQDLVRDGRVLLVTILIGNNLMLELVTGLADRWLEGFGSIAAGWREVVLTAVLTPLVFAFGELLPKDLFRRRPHLLLGAVAPVLIGARAVFSPLRWPLVRLSRRLESWAGLSGTEVGRTLGRERLLELVEEGTQSGAIPAHARELAHNALSLRSIPVQRVMVPWSKVAHLDLDRGVARLQRAVLESDHTRLPVLDPAVGVVGYVHQLEVLAAGGAGDLRRHLRPLPSFGADLSVDQALRRLRVTGQRAALVGPPERPLGLVTLKDLVQTISGDLVDW